MYARHAFAEFLSRHRLRDKLRYGVMALCYARHAEQRAFEPRADHSLAHRRAGFIEHPEQRAAFFAVSESLDYFEIAQSRNIEAHEIEFRIERYRRYVIEIVALNKVDSIAPDELKQQIARLKRASKQKPLVMSAATGDGVPDALRALLAVIGESSSRVQKNDESAAEAAPWSP